MMAARVACALPVTPGHRISSDSAWPLRRADGRPFHAASPAQPEVHIVKPEEVRLGGKVSR